MISGATVLSTAAIVATVLSTAVIVATVLSTAVIRFVSDSATTAVTTEQVLEGGVRGGEGDVERRQLREIAEFGVQTGVWSEVARETGLFRVSTRRRRRRRRRKSGGMWREIRHGDADGAELPQ